MLLGAAMLGAVAAGAFASLGEAMKTMSRLGSATAATPPETTRFHSAKRQVYSLLRQLDKESRRAMQALDAADPPRPSEIRGANAKFS